VGKGLAPDASEKARSEDAINARFVPLFSAHSRRIHGFISMLLPSGADADVLRGARQVTLRVT